MRSRWLSSMVTECCSMNKTASKIIGQDLASICDIYSKCLQKITQKIINRLSCPVIALFAPLPSGKTFGVLRVKSLTSVMTLVLRQRGRRISHYYQCSLLTYLISLYVYIQSMHLFIYLFMLLFVTFTV